MVRSISPRWFVGMWSMCGRWMARSNADARFDPRNDIGPGLNSERILFGRVATPSEARGHAPNWSLRAWLRGQDPNLMTKAQTRKSGKSLGQVSGDISKACKLTCPCVCVCVRDVCVCGCVCVCVCVKCLCQIFVQVFLDGFVVPL